jgi:enoyl-CoA hydratase
MVSFENIKLEKENEIAIISINRPEKMNALNVLTIQEIDKAVTNCIADEQIKAMIITGVGEKAFVAGADIAEFSNFSEAEAKKMSAAGHGTFNKIEQSPKPVLAAVNGFALGGGCELAMACHMRIASNHARFGQPEVNLGLIPGYGGTQRLTRLIGRTRATEFLLSGDMITASQADNFGLVNMVTDPEKLMETSLSFLQRICKKSPVAIKNILLAINAFDDPEVNGYETEISSFAASFITDDFKEGVSAFLEKRKPDFKGK